MLKSASLSVDLKRQNRLHMSQTKCAVLYEHGRLSSMATNDRSIV